jgi:hypothetical protein
MYAFLGKVAYDDSNKNYSKEPFSHFAPSTLSSEVIYISAMVIFLMMQLVIGCLPMAA